ncbi:hypothetical protein [Nonomuraea jiangxiensis]|uniref:Amidohydrolase n=1 Tax=Nonomuraea jiangxiensis TaxID=633440 RepID=A0A1G8DG27_9ACTN|nr:hypothetical protein [Nonomuraea jiangxiensis]SDH56658.1 hypothetical protein SAMN05421869_102564 [Nonomuraea jiangxiensis]
MPLIDAHVHVPLLGTLKPAWLRWARDLGPDGLLEDVWDAADRPRPARLDELFAAQGVDVALLFCESPASPAPPSTPVPWRASCLTRSPGPCSAGTRGRCTPESSRERWAVSLWPPGCCWAM